MVEELLKQLDLADQVTFVMKKRHLTYELLIPSINASLPEYVTPVKGRSEVSRAINNGVGRGKKNDAIVETVKTVLGI
ncbi:hypothetical protein [Periweissella ghanensis]|uniref:Uncharacterized protein n=1 Tax=Periweissella ghanensis TaxID=467997 RepID=A0ABN8BR88_9LACO|nr:hypothetical protein [Periweissella ghanensis]MCM0601330.1 hypothetical protein [Periweissella ghanensis]CAH0419380.1 hypothetical protein WGH24286_01830 [Periweissella ghanensis]